MMTKSDALIHAAVWATAATKLARQSERATDPSVLHGLSALAQAIAEAYRDLEAGKNPLTGEALPLVG